MGVRVPFVVSVAGGTGSGKTTVTERLAEVVGPDNLALLQLDSYYCDRSHLPEPEREKLNFDHPEAFDWPRFLEDVRSLVAAAPVRAPVYDFGSHVRRSETRLVVPAQVIVLEGILVLYDPELRALCDLRVFVDTDADVRFIRRLQRDVNERGRSVDSVIDQYLSTVRLSHLQFVEPTKRYADVILPHGGHNDPAIDVLLARVRELL